MEPRIENIPEKKLVGKSLHMSISNDSTPELWRGFMPERKNIKHAIGTDLFSVQVYEPGFNFGDFTIHTEFEKWAAVEVSDQNDLPYGMKSYIIKGGLYAVFHYQGRASDFAETFKYIFYTWFPASPYEVDQREHFEVLGEKYKNNNPDSEEDIWIPIKTKKNG